MSDGSEKGDEDHAVGGFRGGSSTTINAMVDSRRVPVAIALSPGQASDKAAVEALLAVQPAPGDGWAESGYDARAGLDVVAGLPKARNPTAEILILDPRPRCARQALCEEGWQAPCTGGIDRLGPDFGARTPEIRPAERQVRVDADAEAADALDMTPPRQAGAICAAAGVVDETGWAPGEATGMR